MDFDYLHNDKSVDKLRFMMDDFVLLGD